MKFTHNAMIFIVLSTFAAACAEEGKEGSTGIDCGDHGAAHDGHCHCDAGYLFDGETCRAPEEITEICAAGSENEADAGADTDHEEAHHHEACRCPEEETCPCHGTVVTYGGIDYCEPELHDE
jgi:hypothetical protein